MRTFTVKYTLFLLGLFIGVHALAYIADSIDPDDSKRFLERERLQWEQILKRSQETKALAIGNSHTDAINLPALGYDEGVKFTRGDNDLIEIQYEIETLVPTMPHLDTVFIPISYFLFHQNNIASEEVEIRRAHLYSVMPSWRFLSGDFENLLIGKSQTLFPVSSVVREDNWRRIVHALLGGTQKQSKLTVGLAEDDCSHMMLNDLVENARRNRVARQVRLTTEMETNHPNVAGDTFRALTETIQYLQEESIRLVLFTPPYSFPYTQRYQSVDSATIAQMKQNMSYLQEQYGVEYYDCSADPEISTNHQLFVDPDHLNGCGAKLFSAKLGQAMAENASVIAEQG